jgi:exodeoxyribonuclease VII large subunit
MNDPQTLTVLQLTQYIAQIFSLDYRLKDVWVEGEVSNFKQYPSGHAYFTLKDSGSQIKGVMWKMTVARQAFLPSDGDHVRVHGKVEVYADNGVYQLYADSFQPVGIGALYLQFERLKAKLQAEGLFDEGHKRELPLFPRVIGVVTSPGAAAFQDIQNVLRRRFPLAQVLLSPTLVQGEQAPPQIVAAIRALNEHGGADVILVARGGGSIEDLWAFNDERVARAVYESAIPVVTGVGHEIDFTIVDFVSDLRAPTPSAGAELITPDMADLRTSLMMLKLGLAQGMQAQIDHKRGIVENQQNALGHLSPVNRVQNTRQRLDDLYSRLLSATNRYVMRSRERVQVQGQALSAANPANILARGYAIVSRLEDGLRLTNANDAAPGTSVTIQLHTGTVNATVQGTNLP